jgi:hypothetical protein
MSKAQKDCYLPADKCIAYFGSRHKAEIERMRKLPLT